MAAFHCVLKAAQRGLYLSDNNFFNFGLLVTEDATEHHVVIIDAGSRGIGRETLRKKSDVNTTVMRKFWKHCKEESATSPEIEQIWRNPENTLEACLQEAKELWKKSPWISGPGKSSAAIAQEMSERDASQRAMAQATSAFKIIAIVARWTAPEEWNNASAFVSYRAASTTKDLSAEEEKILDELYERLTRDR